MHHIYKQAINTSYNGPWKHSRLLEKRFGDGQLGYEQDQDVQEGRPGGKTKPTGRMLETPEKLFIPYVRLERANIQHLVGKSIYNRKYLL